MRKIIVLFRLLTKFGVIAGIKAFFRLFYTSSPEVKVPSLLHPVFLRGGTSDRGVFEQIFLYNEYNFKVDFTPKVIIDAGANIGLFAVKYKTEFPDALMICIEPDKENFAQLQKNVSPYSGIQLENCGLWSKETRLDVSDKYHQGKWGLVVEENEINGSIAAISFESICEKYKLHRVDILKIDIESSEKEIFSKNYEQIFKRSKVILVELHDWMLEGCAKTFFTALHQSIKNYTYIISGENTIIVNNDID